MAKTLHCIVALAPVSKCVKQPPRTGDIFSECIVSFFRYALSTLTVDDLKPRKAFLVSTHSYPYAYQSICLRRYLTYGPSLRAVMNS